jgi:probable F420-dependent oxidoreductase
MKIGAVVPLGEGDYLRGTATWPELRACADAGEDAGLDALWVYDHLLFRFPGQPTFGIHEAWTVLSALAAVTRRVELGTLVLAMPFRNPAVLAKMAAAVDEVSGGRLILGIGAGWHEPEFSAFGIPFDHRVSRFEEGLRVVSDLLRTGYSDRAGRYVTARDLPLLPTPRPGGPPILVAGKGPRMLGLVARYADQWNTAWLGPATELPPRLEPLHAALAEAGRDPATLAVTVGVNVVVSDLAAGEELPRTAIAGDAAAIAAGLSEYAELGVAQVIASLTPATPEAFAVLGAARGFMLEGEGTGR